LEIDILLTSILHNTVFRLQPHVKTIKLSNSTPRTIFWIRNWSHITTSCSSSSCWHDHLQKSWSSVVSSRIIMKFGRIVHQVNTHRLMDLSLTF